MIKETIQRIISKNKLRRQKKASEKIRGQLLKKLKAAKSWTERERILFLLKRV